MNLEYKKITDELKIEKFNSEFEFEFEMKAYFNDCMTIDFYHNSLFYENVTIDIPTELDRYISSIDKKTKIEVYKQMNADISRYGFFYVKIRIPITLMRELWGNKRYLRNDNLTTREGK